MTDDDLLDICEANGYWLHLEACRTRHAARAAVDQWTALMRTENWFAFEFAASGRHVVGRFVGSLAHYIRCLEATKHRRTSKQANWSPSQQVGDWRPQAREQETFA